MFYSLLLSLTCLFCSSCELHNYANYTEQSLPQAPSDRKLCGSIIDGRYYSCDSSFNVAGLAINDRDTRITDLKTDLCSSVAFENFMGISLKYDVFSIKNFADYLDLCSSQKNLKISLKSVYEKIIMPLYEENFPGIRIVHEEILNNENDISCFLLLYGPISKAINLSTGKNLDNYAGSLLTLKGNHIVHISLYHELFRVTDSAMAKERLLPQLQHYSDDFVCGNLKFSNNFNRDQIQNGYLNSID